MTILEAFDKWTRLTRDQKAFIAVAIGLFELSEVNQLINQWISQKDEALLDDLESGVEKETPSEE